METVLPKSALDHEFVWAYKGARRCDCAWEPLESTVHHWRHAVPSRDHANSRTFCLTLSESSKVLVRKCVDGHPQKAKPCHPSFTQFLTKLAWPALITCPEIHEDSMLLPVRFVWGPES